MRKLAAVIALTTMTLVSACEKTGKGEYEVQKPVVGTQTDTIHTPTVETGTVTDTVNVPQVDVKTEKKEIKIPKVKVNKPE